MASNSASACAIVRSTRRRPIVNRYVSPRSSKFSGVSFSTDQNSVRRSGNMNPSGMTPTTVCGRSLRRSDRPTTDGSPPK
jgi:hypothetical protein